MKPVFIEAVGLIAPGIDGWRAGQSVLRGEAECGSGALPPYSPQQLPPNERRRATPVIRLAFRVAEEAIAATPVPPAAMATVFASSGGDVDVINRLCTALASPQRLISPTDFHNSVHNAPAGYWAIATGSRLPSTTVGAFDSTFAAGLLESACVVHAEQLHVLFVCYDLPLPPPMDAKRALGAGFGCALVLSPVRSLQTLASATLKLVDGGESTLAWPSLERLRTANPAARGLPLLAALAARRAERLLLPSAGRALAVDLQPC